MNLVCESADGISFETASIVNDRAEVSFNDFSISGGEYQYTIVLNIGVNKDQYLVSSKYLGEANSKTRTYEVFASDYDQQIPISKNISCYQND